MVSPFSVFSLRAHGSRGLFQQDNSHKASIGFLGFGAIGTTVATLLMPTSCDFYIYDTKDAILQGKIMDMAHGRHGFGSWGKTIVTKEPQDIFCCDIVVITAGKVRQKGMTTREALIQCNGEIMRHYGLMLREELKKNPRLNPKVIVVTNPLNIMTYGFQHFSQHDPKCIMGMAGLLDSKRLQYILGSLLKEHPKDIQGLVVGPHNEFMIPLRSTVSLRGKALNDEELSEQIWQKATEETKNAGATISKLLSTEETQMSGFLGPASCVYKLVQGLLKGDIHHPLCGPMDDPKEGRWFYNGGLATLNQKGILHMTLPPLSPQEEILWRQGIESLKSNINTFHNLFGL